VEDDAGEFLDSFGQATAGLGEVAHQAGIDDGDGNAGGRLDRYLAQFG
jgi:hypothetical protein